MPIAAIGVLVRITPGDELMIVHGPADHEFIADETPFWVRVTTLLREDEEVIGIAGPVVLGHSRSKD